MFLIANLVRYAIGADLALVMRAQVSGLETSSERKRAARLGSLAGISVEEGAKKGIEPGIGAPPCKSVHGGPPRGAALQQESKRCKNHAEVVRTQKRRPRGRLGVEFVCVAAGRLPPCAVLVPRLSFSAFPPPWPKSALDWSDVARSWP